TALATGGKATRLSPSLAPAPGGSFLAGWAERNPERNTDGKQRAIRYSVYSGGNWSAPGDVFATAQFVEEPKAVVDATGKATVIWRGYGRGGKSALFASEGQMPNPTWSEPKQITHDDTVQWQPAAAVGNDNKVLMAWNGYDAKTGQKTAPAGVGVDMATPNPGTAALTNTYSAQAVDADGNQIYEALKVTVGVNVLAAGKYKVVADLYAGDKFIDRAELVREGLAAGNQTFDLVFPGGVIANRELNGPYSLRNVVVLDMKEAPVQTAYAAAPSFTTQAYQASRFIAGPLTLDKTTYEGTASRATITVKDAAANKSATAKDQLLVQAASTKNAKGFTVTLEETDVNTGIFVGTVGFSMKANDLQNRNILVADHDILTVVYNDTGGYKWTETAVWKLMSAGLGDLNSDGKIDLADAVMALRLMASLPVDADINPLGMIDDKGKITFKEVIYILQKIAGLR
ncbi:MAG: hypothetical protein N2Z74_03730, partial [Syntrophales bacterium]|nr:hypothetical protein [Syntrophales bacterium]